MSAPGWTFRGCYDKRSALWACAMMWQWLAATGSENKREYLELVHRPEINAECAACSWALAHGASCAECIMTRVWGGDGCVRSKGSPYALWYRAQSPDGRKRHARVIYEGARDLLLEEVASVEGKP